MRVQVISAQSHLVEDPSCPCILELCPETQHPRDWLLQLTMEVLPASLVASLDPCYCLLLDPPVIPVLGRDHRGPCVPQPTVTPGGSTSLVIPPHLALPSWR